MLSNLRADTNGPTEAEIAAMLDKIGASSLDELINQNCSKVNPAGEANESSSSKVGI